MEAAGSRQSRAASRYAASPSAPVFTGPVRKWKKQWVSYSNTNTNTNTKGVKRDEAPPLLLCRWTPLSSADEPPARRFRYTPIVPIEKGKTNEGGGVDDDDEGGAARFINQSNNEWDGMVEKPSTGDFSKEEEEEEEEEEAQEVSEDQSRF